MKLNMIVVMTMWLPRGLQPGRDERPERADHRRADDREREDQPPGQDVVEGERDDADAEAGDIGLALAADVEEAAVEGDGDRKAGEDEVGRVVEREADALAAAERAVDQDDRGAERVLADEEHDQAGDEEGDEQIDQRDQAVVGPGGQLCVRAYSLRGLLPFDAGHQQAELAFGRLRPALADDAAVAHDEDAVGERADLVELDGDEQDRLAAVAHGDELAVDELDRADIDAARRLADEEHGRIVLHLAREHDLLLVAAGEIRGLQPAVGRADVVLLDLAFASSRMASMSRNGPFRYCGSS